MVSELGQSASQNLSKKDGAVKTASSFRKGFVRLIGANSETKKLPAKPPWLTDGIDGRRLCTLIFSVACTNDESNVILANICHLTKVNED